MEQMDGTTEWNLEILAKPSESINGMNFLKSPRIKLKKQCCKPESNSCFQGTSDSLQPKISKNMFMEWQTRIGMVKGLQILGRLPFGKMIRFDSFVA